ncbi:TonB-dependent receptor [Sulfurimonas sp.]|uniref:TonB-dependent receptor n=1 Tax=Sulfurimonas sp. TaxID=2022749 RepID=UPI002628CAD6|nr:TonB-dependent receptor [Sulfurimonas sp.]MDD5157906.1 TonB-dependent receptor [Sulfurimonas sp.]
MKIKILLSLLTSTILVAQTIELEPLVIKSTLIKTDELRSTDAIEIYTSSDIQKAHVQNIYEFLNQQTSVIAMPAYGNPFTQKLDMRGFGIGDGYQNIVVTVDGRRLNNIDMVAPLLSAISPASIERIEIIKSGGIVANGDGANAGVINILTKKDSTREVSVYGGTYGMADGSFYLGHSDDKLSISASGEVQKSDGIRNVDSVGGKDNSKLKTASLNISYIPTKELELRAGASFARIDVIYGGTMKEFEYENDPSQQGTNAYGSSVSSHQKFDTDAVNAGMSYQINSNLSLNVDANHEEKTSNFITYSSIADYKYNSAKTTFEYATDALSISAGLDLLNGERDSHVTSYSVANETTKNNLAGFIMSNFRFGDHSIKAGYRYETVNYKFRDTGNNLENSHSLYGAELGYNYMISRDSSLFLNYAHSYQAPDIDRFFNKDWTGVVSFNGFINPSKADSITIGYSNIIDNNKLKLSAYYISLNDEIYYYADPSYTNSKNTNIDKSHKYGIDVYDKYLLSNTFSVALNYNFVQAIIDKERENGEDFSGKKLPGVSNHNIKATLNYLLTQHTTVALTQTYRSDAYAMDDFSNSFSQKQDAYKSTDISATYKKENYEFFAKINNLFNQKNGLWVSDDAIYPVNYTTTAIAGLKIKF